MEANSSGEDLVVKVRKPYTITKQREKWTEEEHDRFLHALKLYGRAWQRIEEHIGTKTAVQIRSHAQKFFTKLEKEALAKGIPPGQEHDIDIPPPRPKRKPSNPYPRKTGINSTSSTVEATNEQSSKSFSLLDMDKQVLATESNIPEEFATTKKPQAKEVSEDGSSSEVVNVIQDGSSASIYSTKKGASIYSTKKGSKHLPLMEFSPTIEALKEKITSNNPLQSLELDKQQDRSEPSSTKQEDILAGECLNSQMSSTQKDGGSALKLQALKSCENIKDDQIDPKQIFDVKETQSSDLKKNHTTVTGHLVRESYPSTNSTFTAMPEHLNISMMGPIHHPFPVFTPFNHCHNISDAYRPFMNISSTFSSLIFSTLMQNPAVHAAASMAASFWPSSKVENSMHSVEVPEGQMNTSPSMSDVAAATIAAAAAWWASQGLMPWFLPPPFGFGCAPISPVRNTVPAVDDNHPMTDEGTSNTPLKEELIMNQDKPDVPKQLPKTLSSLLTSNTEESKQGGKTNVVESSTIRLRKPSVSDGNYDSDKAMTKQKKYRSSCGSNTSSSSDIETEAILENNEKKDDEAKETLFNNSSLGETINRKSRFNGSMNDSWKEVSEEGRLAFQELFKRDILPQSFPQAMEAVKTLEEHSLSVDLNKKACPETDRNKEETPMASNDNTTRTSSVNESGYGKLKICQTGFKPYKRCAVEATENKVTGEETGSKRICLHGDTSI